VCYESETVGENVIFLIIILTYMKILSPLRKEWKLQKTVFQYIKLCWNNVN
jgi:hypothetical protein